MVITDHQEAPTLNKQTYDIMCRWCREAKADFNPRVLRLLPKGEKRNFTFQFDRACREIRYNVVGFAHSLEEAIQACEWIQKS